MKKYSCLLSFAIFLFIQQVTAQSGELTRDYKLQAITQLAELLTERYVFPEIGKSSGDYLLKKLNEGEYDSIKNTDSFAKILTEDLQSVNHDKHMRVRRPVAGQRFSPEESAEAGFHEVKILDGNIGYIDMRLFFPGSQVKSTIDKHISSLSQADAIIIDLRNNKGGSPETVQYLCSYFFNKKTHLNSIYRRSGNSTTEFWTVDVAGKKMPDIPLYILTGKKTFSAAEEFSYNMQTQKRAVLIGATTGGGANPGAPFNINEELSIFIPTGKAINPITGTNWEGIGVVPDFTVEEDLALENAKMMAAKAAVSYKNQKKQN